MSRTLTKYRLVATLAAILAADTDATSQTAGVPLDPASLPGRIVTVRRFEAFGESNLTVNGEMDPTAELFSDPADHSLLVLSRKLRNAFGLSVDDRGVYRIPRYAVQIENEGIAALVADTVRATKVGSYAFVDSAAAFGAEGMSLRVVPKAPASGEIAMNDLLEYCPEYRYRRDRYTPVMSAIHDLAGYGDLTEVIVLFSLSSPPCGVWVPRTMKIFQAAGSPVFTIRYILVDSPEDPTARRYGANVLPTILLAHDGDELGRIEQVPRTTLEEEILAILKGDD